MHLSTKTTYSIRAVADIAKNAKNEKVMVKDIAERQGIEISYLEQLLNKLKNKGILKAKRGPKGGYNLVKKPEKISLYDIAKAQDDKIEPVLCLSGMPCPRAKTCISKNTWKKVYKEIKKNLIKTTIKDLLKN